MSSLRLRMASTTAGSSLASGLLAAIHAIDSAGISRKIQEVQVPIGTDSPFQAITLAPGRYMLEIRLPSGEILNEMVELAEKQTKEFTFQLPANQEQQLFGWQDSVAGVMKLSTPQLSANWTDSLLRAMASPVLEQRDGMPILARRMAATSEEENLQVHLWQNPGGTATNVDAADFLQGLVEALRNDGGFIQMAQTEGHLQTPAFQDRTLEVYRFSRDDHGQAAESIRDYALIQQGRRRLCLVSLPLPWQNEESPTVIELAVRKKPTAAHDLFSLVVRDQHLSAPLAYLANDNVAQAAGIYDLSLAQKLLYDKVRNPLGAALGGYILLLSDLQKKDNDREQWHEWVAHLKDWFAWLPDGAIQYAWLKLDHQQNDDDVEEARKALLLACRRGLPYYAKGMSLLVDGLRLFKEDGDAESSVWLDRILPIAWRTDMAQVFVSVLIADAFRHD